MKFLKRKLYGVLEKWKESGRQTAFCITGARQTGKKTLARHFASAYYSHLIELNFLEDPDAKGIFSGSLHPENLYLLISAYTGLGIIPGQTLLLLEEIQECPNARTAVKFLAEDGKCAVIETGSMMGVNIASVPSYPVGYEEIHHLYPLDFEEYLWALDTPQTVLDYLKKSFETLVPLTEAFHQSMLKTYQQYLIIGGMPAVVINFLETRSPGSALKAQKRILDLYRSDITRYASRSEIPDILDIYDAIPAQLDAKNQRFIISQVFPGKKGSRIQSSFLWLTYAGVAFPCYNLKEPQPPLLLNESRSLFKLFFLDPGLLSAASLSSVQYEILQGNLEINQASILENAAACQLKASGFDLFYYNSKKTGELDFVIQNAKYPDILEIKSGNSWTKHPALNNALNTANWTFNQSWVFCKGNIEKEMLKSEDGKEHTIMYLPVYMLMFLKPDFNEKHLEDTIPLVDFSSLVIPE